MSRTLEVFEHQRLYVDASKTPKEKTITPQEFDALVEFNERHGRKYFEVGHRYIKTTNFVGYVEVGSLAIEVLPKADLHAVQGTARWRDGLLEMLRIALGLRLDQHESAPQKQSRHRLLDLVARAYLAELELLLREGLARGYRTERSNGSVFRGRLVIASHIRENVVRSDRFFVEYQTFDREIVVNRVLVAALEVLSACGLSPSVSARVSECRSRFPDLETRSVSTETFDRIQLTRATLRYANALVYAKMIISQRSPHLRHGRERVFALLFDMNKLWEQYVAALCRRAAPAGVRIVTQEHHAFWKPSAHPIQRVAPDIVVRDRDNKTLLVIDTKWKVPDGLPSAADLKQMFVYNELLSGGRAILLYPCTSDGVLTVRGNFALRDHHCEQCSVGLFDGARWSSSVIKRQLGKLLQSARAA